MIFVLCIVVASGTVAMAAIAMSSAVNGGASKEERGRKGDLMIDGAMEKAQSELNRGIVKAGDTKVYFIGGQAVTVAVTDNSKKTPNSAILTATLQAAKGPKPKSKPVAIVPKIDDNFYRYGIYSNSGFTWRVAPSNVTGCVFFRNSMSVLASGTVTKDYKTCSSNNGSALTIKGNILTGVTTWSWPMLMSATYLTAATNVLVGDQTFNGYTFPSNRALTYVTGNLTLRGTVNGTGTIFATGNVTIDGNISKGKPSEYFAVITPGTITFTGTGTTTLSLHGVYFAGGTVDIEQPISLTGCLVGGSFIVNDKFSINNDPPVIDSNKADVLKLPGFFP